jgi:hypothetical protein
MPLTKLARPARSGRLGVGSFAAFLALFACLATTSLVLPTSTALACDITRKVYNRTDRNLYVEIWRNGTLQWTSTEPLKPGGTMALDYLTIGDEILLTGPDPVADWQTNAFGVVLEIFRCDILRISGASKLGAYDVKVSRRQNADILLEAKKQ